MRPSRREPTALEGDDIVCARAIEGARVASVLDGERVASAVSRVVSRVAQGAGVAGIGVVFAIIGRTDVPPAPPGSSKLLPGARGDDDVQATRPAVNIDCVSQMPRIPVVKP